MVANLQRSHLKAGCTMSTTVFMGGKALSSTDWISGSDLGRQGKVHMALLSRSQDHRTAMTIAFGQHVHYKILLMRCQNDNKEYYEVVAFASLRAARFWRILDSALLAVRDRLAADEVGKI
jgi:hypothetical protein